MPVITKMTQELILSRRPILYNRKNIMQSNIYTNKIHKTSKAKQEPRENSVKTAHKGKTWKRDMDKREMYNYALKAR